MCGEDGMELSMGKCEKELIVEDFQLIAKLGIAKGIGEMEMGGYSLEICDDLAKGCIYPFF